MSDDSSPESRERLFVIRAVIALTTDSVVRKNEAVSKAESSSSNCRDKVNIQMILLNCLRISFFYFNENNVRRVPVVQCGSSGLIFEGT